MAAKRDAQKWMERCLGKKVAHQLFRKAERMATKGATVAKIEKAIAADMMVHIRTRVVRGVVYKASGPGGPHRPHVVYGIPISVRPGTKAKGTK